jgi:hypothetical protein
MDMKYCLSCALPLDPSTQNFSVDYCGNCCTADNQLKSREEVARGLAQWMKMWQPGLDDATALERATAYMSAMPAWAAK